MREGINNYNYTVLQLNVCSTAFDGCDDCPDKVECVKRFDARCSIWKDRVNAHGLIEAMSALQTDKELK